MKAKVTSKGLNLREEPNEFSKVINVLKLNDEVQVLKQDLGKWTKVSYGIYNGYVATRFIEIVEGGGIHIVSPIHNSNFNTATLDLIKEFESLHDGNLSVIGLQPKMCPAGIWTEGYGRAMIDPKTNKFLKGAENKNYAESIRTIKTEADAIKALDEDLLRYESIASNEIGHRYWELLNENQQGAVVSFVYNCGLGFPTKYKIFINVKSYLDKKMNKESLSVYWQNSVIKGGGKTLKGLVKRRKAESQLFFKY